MSDPEGRPAIGDLVRGLHEHLFPVGRLDFESSGLVLLTNDGQLAQKLTHPRFEVAKVYSVKVRGQPDEAALDRLRSGVRLSDGITAPAEVAVERRLEAKTRLRITLREGRQRQVRRMCEAVGHPVDRLTRIAIGPLRLASLKVGEMRDLTPREVLALRRATEGRPAARRPSGASTRTSGEARGTARASARGTHRARR
jgi:pseudouridine synthase